MTVRIGLTGPIGCGKSTVAGWLGERAGVVVIDADRVAREVLEPAEPALDAVIARFGGGLVGPARSHQVMSDHFGTRAVPREPPRIGEPCMQFAPQLGEHHRQDEIAHLRVLETEPSFPLAPDESVRPLERLKPVEEVEPVGPARLDEE